MFIAGGVLSTVLRGRPMGKMLFGPQGIFHCITTSGHWGRFCCMVAQLRRLQVLKSVLAHNIGTAITR